MTTVRGGKPWICTVYFVADDGFNFYWTSGRSRQHSLEILSNSKTAVTVVRNTERKQALQMTGEAYEVDDSSLTHVHELYCDKFGANNYDLEEIKKHEPDGHGYWVFKPTNISI